jgi:hypothetical protein
MKKSFFKALADKASTIAPRLNGSLGRALESIKSDRRRLFMVVIGGAATTSLLLTFAIPRAKAFFFEKGCEGELKKKLRDPESYRRESPPSAVLRTNKGKSITWTFNAKNSFGGYGDTSEVLCVKQYETGSLVLVFPDSSQEDTTDAAEEALALISDDFLKRVTLREEAARQREIERQQRIAQEEFQRQQAELQRNAAAERLQAIQSQIDDRLDKAHQEYMDSSRRINERMGYE